MRINFEEEKHGYNKIQVAAYLKKVQAEYNKMYDEFSKLDKENAELHQKNAQLSFELTQLKEKGSTTQASKDQMEAIALALIDAETEARRIVDTARDKAWKILSDAKRGRSVEKPKLSSPKVSGIVTSAESVNAGNEIGHTDNAVGTIPHPVNAGFVEVKNEPAGKQPEPTTERAENPKQDKDSLGTLDEIMAQLREIDAQVSGSKKTENDKIN